MSSELKIDYWDIGRLKEYDNNPRVNEHAVEPLARFIDEFGFRVPILAQSNGLICDGHLRFKAAKALGMVKVPVIVVDDLSESQIKALRVGVNKMSDLAQFDFERLAIELKAIDTGVVDVMLLGFDENELHRIMSGFEAQQFPSDESMPGAESGEAQHATCPRCGFKFEH